MTELHALSATELAPLIKGKKVSPVELIETILSRINQLDGEVNSYITVLPELALEKARHAESQIMNGVYEGPLHGIPVGIKDNYETKGIRTTVGSGILSDYIPHTTATTVKKLSCAGGIMTGKLNMHEFGGGLTNTNPVYGHSRNPWNIDYSPGGSSGGSAAALAAGLATLATGTDTFGSIRVPAAMCGIYGLKPTYGLVSTNGVLPLAWSLDHAGPMARSVSDVALMLNVMAGYDAEDPGSIKTRATDYTHNLSKGIKGLKVGVPSFFLQGLDPEVEQLFQQALLKLEELGAMVKEISIPQLEMSSFSNYVITTGEAATYHYEKLQQIPEQYASDVRTFFTAGVLTHTPQYVRAQQVRRSLTEAIKKEFEDVDMMVAPTIPITTPKFQDDWIAQNLAITKKCMPFTSPANVTGTPSLSVPMGRCSKGLPVGMQFIGNHQTEKLLLQAGEAWEQTDPLTNTLEK
ncbi:aspartyl-tRNA(Asn) amidotransferase subunit A [Halalkalibacter wakoensis JCM 9140]|uniref:Aspartyl-tRNA(Asn) amidotransferase subunit A n=1 Tax=Halalkalibacter wakoensis JCM 9140 TaxID=1236970 RepID=W4PZF4_9BACI|nr:Asp-tRNA(Asn)/Glu-tRNA(Gln) amidotransferase GatCAB subunit A [Halalkalibacter wakoensis]GAE24863.1 aspartyl-tRNA(Asn) amidotransferase subunit A [Halalkalibacter wakoensis JCM 9140]